MNEPVPGNYAVWRGVDRTETGILLFIAGLLLGPTISFTNAGTVGETLSIAGAIMIALGRLVFGQRHSRFVIAALLIYFGGVAASTLNYLDLLVSLNTVNYNRVLIGSIFVQIISGMAILLFTYKLQKRVGQLLLWAGYISSVIVVVLFNPTLFLLRGQIDQTVVVYLLGLVPATVSATAFYLARLRIKNGELSAFLTR